MNVVDAEDTVDGLPMVVNDKPAAVFADFLRAWQLPVHVYKALCNAASTDMTDLPLSLLFTLQFRIMEMGMLRAAFSFRDDGREETLLCRLQNVNSKGSSEKSEPSRVVSTTACQL